LVFEENIVRVAMKLNLHVADAIPLNRIAQNPLQAFQDGGTMVPVIAMENFLFQDSWDRDPINKLLDDRNGITISKDILVIVLHVVDDVFQILDPFSGIP
jgi:hypothetical protein